MSDPVASNFNQLEESLDHALKKAKAKLKASEQKYLVAYKRLLSINAWRHYVLNASLSEEVLSFYIEAQNDLLISLVLAKQGMWRPSLQSLRSAIENVMACLYFKDHPVELQLWSAKRFRLSFTMLRDYFASHPLTARNQARQIMGIDLLERQYETLSKAVHGSGLEFRMTGVDDLPVVYVGDSIKLNKWMTNQSGVITGLNLLLIGMFSTAIKGAAFPHLRASISLVVRGSTRAAVKSLWGVTIPK